RRSQRPERAPPRRGARRGARRTRHTHGRPRGIRAGGGQARGRWARARRQGNRRARRDAPAPPRRRARVGRRRRARARPLSSPAGTAQARHRRGSARRMIASLAGTLSEKTPERITVDAGGVGYGVHVSLQTFADLPPAGAEVRLLVHTEVREDAIELFGFLRPEERALFHLLRKVKGVGPRTALVVLSGMPLAALVAAIGGAAAGRPPPPPPPRQGPPP